MAVVQKAKPVAALAVLVKPAEEAIERASRAIAQAIMEYAKEGSRGSYAQIHKLSRIGHAIHKLTAKRIEDFRANGQLDAGNGAWPNMGFVGGGGAADDLNNLDGPGLGVDAPVPFARNVQVAGFGDAENVVGDLDRVAREALLVANEHNAGAAARRASEIALNEACELEKLRDQLRTIAKLKTKCVKRSSVTPSKSS